MVRLYILASGLFLCLLPWITTAQVAINADNSQPHVSAGLDVKFPDRGFLPPRVTHAELLAIPSPADGLMAFCTNCATGQTGAFCIYQQGAWRIVLSTCLSPLTPGAGTHSVQATSVTWNWLSVGWATGYKWSSINDYSSATDMGTATSKSEAGLSCNTGYTRFVWAYNSCGNSPVGNLTATTASTPPASPLAGSHSATASQVQWNWTVVPEATGYKWSHTNNYAGATDVGNNPFYVETGLACNTAYTRYVWAYNTCGHSAATTLTKTTLSNPPSPVAGTHTAGQNFITWNWNSVPGAAGYRFSSTNNYITATNIGNVTSRTETGLPCNSVQTRFIWAYNACGFSLVTVLTFSTAPCGPSCPTSVTDPRDGQTYGVVGIGTQCWMSSNMNVGVKIPGVNDQMNNMIIEKYCYDNDDANCSIYGGLYQWGEAVQYANGASNNSSWNPPPPGHVQGICPPGWHVPSQPEWDILVNYLGGASVAGGKLKEAGLAHWADPNTDATNISGFTGLPGGQRLPMGMFAELTFSGYFWTSTEASPTTAFARQLLFNSGAINTLAPDKVFGLSVRCLMNY